MSERFFILPYGDYDFFITDSKMELKPFIISDVKYNDVIRWFENGVAVRDEIVLNKVCLNDEETLFIGHFSAKQYDFGFCISTLSKKDLYDIVAYLDI